MHEHDWLTSDDPRQMLTFLMTHGNPRLGAAGSFRPSDRKLRLWACACWRAEPARHGTWHEFQAAIAEHEEILEGRRLVYSPRAEMWASAKYDSDTSLAEIHWDLEEGYLDRRMAASLLRDVVGNPFRRGGPPWQCDSTVLSLAQAAYEDRLPDGTLDPVRLMVLADALEDAGLHGTDLCPHCGGKGCQHGRLPHPLLAHLREPGLHVRGCHAVDCILGKS